MNTKPKLSEVAKDLKVQNQEIIDLLASAFGGDPKKSTAALTAEEMNFLLETYTQKNQVGNFDSYFAERTNRQPAKTAPQPSSSTPEKSGASKPASAGAASPARKSAAVNSNGASKKPSVHSQPAASGEKKFMPKAANAQPPKQTPAPSTSGAPVSGGNNTPRPAAAVSKPASAAPKTTPAGSVQQGRQPAKQPGQAQFQNRQPAANHAANSNAPHANQNRNGQSPAARPAPAVQSQTEKFRQQAEKARQVQNQTAKNVKEPAHNQPRKQEHGVRQQLNANVAADVRMEQNVRKVDTRGNYVELDKYNEKYEQIAPQTPGGNNRGRDNFSKKQKITQKSKQHKNQQFSNKRESEAEKLRRLELERARKQQLRVLIPDEIVVAELASRLKVTASQVIKKLMGLGMMSGINDTIDFDTAALIAEELGAKVEREVIMTIEERLIADEEDTDDALVQRSPIVVVMGHVDHGKTSLLDRIRNANVTASEAGGITQHIGAYRVKAGDGHYVTFLDTPGHAAFTAMRARGAQCTDIAIIVVAADDGIMPQTVEAIDHAKAAGVGIIVAINKMDKPEANPDRVKQELTEHGLVVEEWGGDTICVPVSAKTGEGIESLLEMISLVADVRELKANPDRRAKGVVVEARLDKGKGPIATILVQNGTLHTGDVIIAGTAVGRVRVMADDKGRTLQEAGPSVPVEITGLADVPAAGDIFNAVEDERLARELVEQRRHEQKEEQFSAYQKVTLDNLFSQIEQGSVKELPIIVKADVQGSVEAVRQSLEKISNEEVRVRVIHGGVGAVSESDVMLASASNAIIVGFNVRPDPVAAENAARDGVDIRLYRIIYDAIEEIETAMKGMLAPKYREVQQGRIEVRQVYRISNVGAVAGAYVLDGKILRSSQIRVVRDGIVVAEDQIDSLKRFKDDVKEVAAGYECGIGLDKFNDFKEGDIFEAFIMEEYRD